MFGVLGEVLGLVGHVLYILLNSRRVLKGAMVLAKRGT